MIYYEIDRIRTCKAIGSKSDYNTWDHDTKSFASIGEAKAFLAGEYSKSKRTKMYVDTKSGETKHVGYIYHYNTPKASYDDQAKNNQDWIEVKEIKATTIII